MNDGYIFLIGSWILIILLYTHWLDFIWQNDRNLKQKRRIAIIIGLLMIMLQGIYLPIGTKLSLNVGLFILTACIFLYYFWRDQSGYRLQTLCVMIFLGIFYAVSYQLFFLDPILMVISPLYMLPAFMTFFIILTTTDRFLQWLMMAGGLLLGEVIHKTFLLKHVPQVFIGDALFRDQLLFAFVILTMSHMLMKAVVKGVQFALRYRQSHGNQEG